MKLKLPALAADFASGFLARLLRDEEGQATVEYILILSVVVVGASAIARTVLNTLDQGILSFGGQLEKDLHTGKATLNAWSN
jgi:Flp pilus assembly pilin Flp